MGDVDLGSGVISITSLEINLVSILDLPTRRAKISVDAAHGFLLPALLGGVMARSLGAVTAISASSSQSRARKAAEGRREQAVGKAPILFSTGNRRALVVVRCAVGAVGDDLEFWASSPARTA